MKKLQKHALLTIAAAMSMAFGVATASAQDAAPHKKVTLEDARGGGAVVSVTGEITAVDAANRVVSIKGPKGNVSDLRVDSKVKNFEQIKVGDRVRMTYRIGVALALVKGGDGIREKVESEAKASAEQGAKPGGGAIKQTTIVADVQAVDKKKKVVTLKGPSGQVVDVAVKDPKALHDVKVGDQVVASVTESIAVSVHPAPAAAK